MNKDIQRMNELLKKNETKLKYILNPKQQSLSVNVNYDKDSIYIDSHGFIMNKDSRDIQKIKLGFKVYQDLNTDRVLLGHIGDQIELTQIFLNIIDSNFNIAKTITNPFTFKKMVQKYGVWDYKYRQGHLLGKVHIDGLNEFTLFKFFEQRMRSTDFGNFHFGIMALSTFIPWTEEFILEQAGQAQIRDGTSRQEWQTYSIEVIGGENISVLQPPYGDDPIDQLWIKRGFAFYKDNFPNIRP